MSNRDYLLLIYTCMTYVYNTISDDNNSKFLKSPKSACLVRVWEWHGIDTDCPAFSLYK